MSLPDTPDRPYLTLHLAVTYNPDTGWIRLTDSFEESTGERTIPMPERFPADRPEALNGALRHLLYQLVMLEEKRARERRRS